MTNKTHQEQILETILTYVASSNVIPPLTTTGGETERVSLVPLSTVGDYNNWATLIANDNGGVFHLLMVTETSGNIYTLSVTTNGELLELHAINNPIPVYIFSGKESITDYNDNVIFLNSYGEDLAGAHQRIKNHIVQHLIARERSNAGRIR